MGVRGMSEIDFGHFQNFWIEQQKTAVHMSRDMALAHIRKFIENHDMGKAELYGGESDELKKLLAFKGIPFDAVKAAKVAVVVVRVKPSVFEMYDTDFVKEGYDIRQIVRFDEE